MRRERHRLDLLPLLDVFMVVLFVFATIQEQQLDETTRAASRDRAANEELAQRLDDAARELDARDAMLRASDASAEADALRERARESDDELAQIKAKAQASIAELATGDDAVRRHEVLTKLLDRYTVFEIEVAGAVDESGAVVNNCCFRRDPLTTTWESCGEIPPSAAARATWWDGGGGGLDLALRRTKGGNAMTIIRQDERASYRMAAHIEELLRDHFPDHQVYDEGVSLAEIHHCGVGRE
jgi:biopolymer transport protein ExbD